MKIVQAYLSGTKNGEPLELEDPRDVRRELPDTMAYVEATARHITTELTTGHPAPTRAHLAQALIELERELSPGFLQVRFHSEEGCEVNITLQVTRSEHRAELEAFHPETGLTVREELASTHPIEALSGKGGIRIKRSESGR